MRQFIDSFLDDSDKQHIDAIHEIQQNHYGVFIPPSLKQLIYLRNLLISLRHFTDLKPEDLLGLSKIECRTLMQKLNKPYSYHHMSQRGRGERISV